MSEVATVLGGLENVEQAVVTIASRANPAMIGICSTGVTETKGDDVDGFIKLIRQRHPELDDIEARVRFDAGLQRRLPGRLGQGRNAHGGAACRRRLRCAPRRHADQRAARLVISRRAIWTNCATSSRRSACDPLFLPDISGSLDGHVPRRFHADHHRRHLASTKSRAWAVPPGPSRSASRCAAPRRRLSAKARRAVPAVRPADRPRAERRADRVPHRRSAAGRCRNKFRRQRSQLVDAMLDGHFFFGGKKIAIGAEPDLLWSVGTWLAEMGCTISAAVTTTRSPMLEQVPAEKVLIGDLEDLESGADGLRTAGHPFARAADVRAAAHSPFPHGHADIRPARRGASSFRSAIAARAISFLQSAICSWPRPTNQLLTRGAIPMERKIMRYAGCGSSAGHVEAGDETQEWR